MRLLNEHETSVRLKAHRLDQPRGPGFSFRDRARNTAYDWHTHAYHQLIYAARGATQVETDEARYTLPSGAAVWIPAGVRHRTLIGNVEGASLYFSPEEILHPSSRVRVLIASPVMREMILYASRWSLGATDSDPVAASFFRALALLCGRCLDTELPLSLPTTPHPRLRQAMDYVFAALPEATLDGAVSAARMSERTFRRRFIAETGLTWQAWLTRARVLAGLGGLMEGRRVTDVATEVGYSSLSAFAKAFTQLTGESPRQFRSRVRLPGGPSGEAMPP